MTLTDARVFVTVISFICFIGILFWAFSSHRKKAFDEAAMLPFTDDEPHSGNSQSVSQHGAQQ
ncbi:MAG: cbb3-type cytochrome c oxidase subunit 3 [Chitinivorax sp.]